VPAVTSDLAGFGSYIMGRFPDHDENGMYVARRDGVSLETTVYQVAGWLQGMVNMTLRDRISLRNRVESFADEFDWSKMTRAYRAARRLAFDACYPGQDILRPD
jgi:glycogen(starch) synthase